MAAKQFLLDKFHICAISRGTDIIWPEHSPDLNPLDFYFWASAQKEVYAQKPETIDSVIECVRGFAEACNEDIVRRVAGNVLKRARLSVCRWGPFSASTLGLGSCDPRLGCFLFP